MSKVEMVEAIKVLTNTLEVLVGMTDYRNDGLVEVINGKIVEYVKML